MEPIATNFIIVVGTFMPTIILLLLFRILKSIIYICQLNYLQQKALDLINSCLIYPRRVNENMEENEMNEVMDLEDEFNTDQQNVELTNPSLLALGEDPLDLNSNGYIPPLAEELDPFSVYEDDSFAES